MNLETFKRDIKARYRTLDASHAENKIAIIIQSLQEEWKTDIASLSFQELRTLVSAILEEETLSAHEKLEDLIVQKERIERQIARQSDDLQNIKYTLFNGFETLLSKEEETLQKLHTIKIQSLDLLDILEEMKDNGSLDEHLIYFEQALDTFYQKYPHVFLSHVGLGMMRGLRVKDGETLSNIIAYALEEGVIVLKAGRNTLRFLPPLTITKENIDEGFLRLERALKKIQ